MRQYKSGYFWQTADSLASIMEVDATTVYYWAREGQTHRHHVCVESRPTAEWDRVSGRYRKLVRVKPPYYGSGIAGDPEWLQALTGVSARVIRQTECYLDPQVNLRIERQTGPLGEFWVAEDVINRTTQMALFDKQNATPWLDKHALSSVLGISHNTISQAAMTGYNTTDSEGGRWKIERRPVKDGEKLHHTQKWMLRGVPIEMPNNPPVSSDELPGEWQVVEDWQPDRELARAIGCHSSTVCRYANSGKILYNRYKLERREATQAERVYWGSPQLRFVTRALSASGVPSAEETLVENEKVINLLEDCQDEHVNSKRGALTATLVALAALVLLALGVTLMIT